MNLTFTFFTCLYAPSCLADDCCLVTDARPKTLRLADTRMLLVNRMWTKVRDQAFRSAGSRIWNNLQTDLRQLD